MFLKKYEFTGETQTLWGGLKVLHRIRAVRDLDPGFMSGVHVCAGDLGGFIEKEENLDHDGDCWVGDTASVMEDASVREDAYICGDALVCGKAVVTGSSYVGGAACVSGHVALRGRCKVRGKALLSGAIELRGAIDLADVALSIEPWEIMMPDGLVAPSPHIAIEGYGLQFLPAGEFEGEIRYQG